MTNKEAMERLNDLKNIFGDIGDISHVRYSIPALGLAIQALEKQIPKKPKYFDIPEYKLTFKTAKCVGCLSIVESPLRQYKYCSECGQAIDWSDTE